MQTTTISDAVRYIGADDTTIDLLKKPVRGAKRRIL